MSNEEIKKSFRIAESFSLTTFFLLCIVPRKIIRNGRVLVRSKINRDNTISEKEIILCNAKAIKAVYAMRKPHHALRGVCGDVLAEFNSSHHIWNQ